MSKGPEEESIRALEAIRPLTLHLVAFTIRVRWWTNAAQFVNSLLISRSLRFLQQRGVSHRIVLCCIGDLAGAHVDVEKVRAGPHHSQGEDRAIGAGLAAHQQVDAIFTIDRSRRRRTGYNSVFKATTMTGNGHTIEALPIEKTVQIPKEHQVIH